MSDTIIFIVGAFVTILWGSMIAALLYAANTTFDNTKSKDRRD